MRRTAWWNGGTGRGVYTACTLVLLAVKAGLDRLLFPDGAWNWFNYLRGGAAFAIGEDVTPGRLAVLGALSLPFLAAGLLLTVRRLRSAGLHPAFSVVLFLPFVKVALAALLMLLPPAVAPAGPRRPDRLGRFIPHGRRSAAVAVLVIVAVGCALVGLSATGLHSYGWSLFLGLPFGLGLLASLLHGYHEPRAFGECLLVGLIAAAAFGGTLFLLAIEGAVCLVMAAPLIGGVVVLGSAVGWAVQREYWQARSRGRAVGAALLLMPGALGIEQAVPPLSPRFAVRTAIEVAAPPAVVWRHVVDFPPLPEPVDPVFRSGIAYPIRATIDGHGPGAIRRCCFNTGDFVEPIVTWDEPRLLAFDVTENPAPMREWSLYTDLNPPHLHGFMVSEHGQFRLIDLGNGHTRLEGTTWYRHGLQPAGYWRVWSDAILHRIHLRVLNHVKRLAEGEKMG